MKALKAVKADLAGTNDDDEGKATGAHECHARSTNDFVALAGPQSRRDGRCASSTQKGRWKRKFSASRQRYYWYDPKRPDLKPTWSDPYRKKKVGCDRSGRSGLDSDVVEGPKSKLTAGSGKTKADDKGSIEHKGSV